MRYRRGVLLWCAVVLLSGCTMLGLSKPKKNPEKELYQELMTAFEHRAYESSITACESFLSAYPESPVSDAVLMRQGESFEGLLRLYYLDRLDEGVSEAKARADFLATYGHYGCWDSSAEELRYNKAVFRQLLEEKPESNYADEAFYNLITYARDYQGRPEPIEKEIAALQEVLTKYPMTSLQPKILFQIGYRCQLLYELYAFSKDRARRDQEKAQQSYHQAEYSYKLCLGLPWESEYSKKALRYLDMLQTGERIYRGQ